MNRKPATWLSVAPILVFSFGAVSHACGSDNAQRPTPTAEPTERALETPLPVQSIISLGPSARPVTYQVNFAWLAGDPRFVLGPGAFVWRQSTSLLRWDVAHSGFDNPGSGSIREHSEGDSTRTCQWVRPDLTGRDVGVQCDRPEYQGAPGPFAAFDRLLEADAYALQGERVIAGRNAVCYGTIDRSGNVGTLCVDDEIKLPVYMSAIHPSTGHPQIVEATSVADPSDAPFGFVSVPPPGVFVDIGVLQLPAEFQFDCC